MPRSREVLGPYELVLVRKLLLLWRIASEHHVWPLNTDLPHALRGPFVTLVALVLSVRNRDSRVNAFLGKNTPILVALPRMSWVSHVRLFKDFGLRRYRTIFLLSRVFPRYRTGDDCMWLRKLPMIGPKVYKLFLNLCFGAPEVAVDTHVASYVARLSGRRLCGPVKVDRFFDRWKDSFTGRCGVGLHYFMLRVNKHRGWCPNPHCPKCVWLLTASGYN